MGGGSLKCGFFGNMTCPHSREQKGKAQHLRLENAGETQQMASPDTRRWRGSVQRGQEEKSHWPGAEQLIASVFAHHLINTGRFLPGAVLFQGWTKPCHHGAIFIHKQEISELETTAAGKRYHIPLISGTLAASLLIQVQQAALMLVLFPKTAACC